MSRADRRRQAKEAKTAEIQSGEVITEDRPELDVVQQDEEVTVLGAPEKPQMEETEQEQLERDVKATIPAAMPEPIPRMDQTRLEARIRIAPRWLKQCPKRPGTIAYDNWHLYTDGMTVSAFLASHDRRRARTDLRWDLDHEFVFLQSAQDYMQEMAEKAAAESDMGEPVSEAFEIDEVEGEEVTETQAEEAAATEE